VIQPVSVNQARECKSKQNLQSTVSWSHKTKQHTDPNSRPRLPSVVAVRLLAIEQACTSDIAMATPTNHSTTTGWTTLAAGTMEDNYYCEDDFVEVVPTNHPLEDATLDDMECIDEETIRKETLQPVQRSKIGVLLFV
jgi:hypothetical protein